MHSIKDLEEHFGWTEWQVRDRIGYLRDSFPKVVRGGNGAKLWVADRGFALLERMKELEKDGHNAKSAIKAIERELENPAGNGDSSHPKVTNIEPKVIQTLEKEIKFLKKQIHEKDRQLEAKDQQIQQFLPGSTNGKGIIRRVWERIW